MRKRWVAIGLSLVALVAILLGVTQLIIPPAVNAFDLIVSIGPAEGPADPTVAIRRDALVSHLVASLPDAWRNATRGMGALRIDQVNPAVQIRVAGVRGTSSFTSIKNRRDEVLIYAIDDIGQVSP